MQLLLQKETKDLVYLRKELSKKRQSKFEDGRSVEIKTGDLAIAAITSCTNTSNPYVMLGAGLVAKKAVEKGLTPPAYVKTSLAPGSKVVTGYLQDSGLHTILGANRIQPSWIRMYNMYR